MDFLLRQQPPLLWEARERLARFLGGDPCRLFFTANVTAAVNLVASGLRLASPGEILLTDHEYGAMHWCWERIAQRRGLTLRTFGLPTMANDPGEIIEAEAGSLSLGQLPEKRGFVDVSLLPDVRHEQQGRVACPLLLKWHRWRGQRPRRRCLPPPGVSQPRRSPAQSGRS